MNTTLIVILVVLVLLAILAAVQFGPELLRYLKVRRM